MSVAAASRLDMALTAQCSGAVADAFLCATVIWDMFNLLDDKLRASARKRQRTRSRLAVIVEDTVKCVILALLCWWRTTYPLPLLMEFCLVTAISVVAAVLLLVIAWALKVLISLILLCLVNSHACCVFVRFRIPRASRSRSLPTLGNNMACVCSKVRFYS